MTAADVQWPPGDRRLFVSTQCYALGKMLGIEGAQREFTRLTNLEQVMGEVDRLSPGAPAARTVRRVRMFGTVALGFYAGTNLPKLRSRAAYDALACGAEYWVMIDDDVETDTSTLARLFALAGRPEAERIVVLPCLLRGVGVELQTVNIQAGMITSTVDGELAYSCEQAGTGLMIVTRGALQRLDRQHNELDFRDDDGGQKCALFHPLLEGFRYLGEDLSFCRRARALEIPIYAPAHGISIHDGHQLDLREKLIRLT